jgi:hypothetical protein
VGLPQSEDGGEGVGGLGTPLEVFLLREFAGDEAFGVGDPFPRKQHIIQLALLIWVSSGGVGVCGPQCDHPYPRGGFTNC